MSQSCKCLLLREQFGLFTFNFSTLFQNPTTRGFFHFLLIGKLQNYKILVPVIFNSFYDHISSSKERSTFPSSLNLLPRTSASVSSRDSHSRIDTRTSSGIIQFFFFNMRHVAVNVPVCKEVKRNLKKQIDALVSLVESSVSYKKKK